MAPRTVTHHCRKDTGRRSTGQRRSDALAPACQLSVCSLDRTGKAILLALVEGRGLTQLVRRLNRSNSALHDKKNVSAS
jgi:hypothetical protein